MKARFEAGPKGTKDLVAEKTKMVEGAFTDLQNFCNISFSPNTPQYWQFMANSLLGWLDEDLKLLARQADQGIFSNPKKMKHLLELMIARSIAEVNGQAYFSPEQLATLTA